LPSVPQLVSQLLFRNRFHSHCPRSLRQHQ
jgi:hypothetical protein